jgi:hypothetical protein
MSIQIPFRLPYTSRDFDSIAFAVKQRIPQDVPEWNDFLQSNVGIMLIHSFSAVADLLCYYLDRQASECYINTCIGKPSIADLGQLINFQLRGAVPGYTTIRVSVDPPRGSDVVIPRYSEFADNSGNNRFTSIYAATLTAGQSYVDIPVRQGEWNSENFAANGDVQQRYIIGRTDVAEGFIRVWVGQEEWLPAQDNVFVGYGNEDQVFRVIKTAIAPGGPQTATPALAPEIIAWTIEFGDNLEGLAPPSGTAIRIDYLVTKGDSIRVPAGVITHAVTNFYESSDLDTPIAVTVVNLDSMVGQQQSESLYSARRRAPSQFRTMRRAVTTFDFQTYAEQFEGVLMAKVYDLNNNADQNDNLTEDRPIPVEQALPFYQARVYVVPRYGYASESLNIVLQRWLQERAAVDKQVVVLNPTPVYLDLRMRLRIYSTWQSTDVVNQVQQKVAQFFELTEDGEITIGGGFMRSRLIAMIQEISGVASVDLIQPREDIGVMTTVVRQGFVRSYSADTIRLDQGSSEANDAYNGLNLNIIAGPGVGQWTKVLSYDGLTQTATIDPPLVGITSSSQYQLSSDVIAYDRILRLGSLQVLSVATV